MLIINERRSSPVRVPLACCWFFLSLKSWSMKDFIDFTETKNCCVSVLQLCSHYSVSTVLLHLMMVTCRQYWTRQPIEVSSRVWMTSLNSGVNRMTLVTAVCFSGRAGPESRRHSTALTSAGEKKVQKNSVLTDKNISLWLFFATFVFPVISHFIFYLQDSYVSPCSASLA